MSMNDPISDMLARIKNAQAVNKRSVRMPSSKVKVAIVSVLKDEGYVRDFEVTEEGAKRELEIELKYVDGRGVIDRLDRFSKPGRRRYFGSDDLPRVLNGLGIAIVSTSNGVMTDAKARAQGHGGEVLCLVA
ncbi:30S ribosomal protein S8 [Wenzhouxiangella marina]|uniref:Small ribosomal subunit protein uS8 n=1 Tax=Wenzhouxiangella marina TaxID=1579979 RepID=A0A0K0XY79_9GAMM|nr:30S ribosomal protein S8 [Wenzhouxiangella marina]AKS42638.1 30S ribosomal protein S8 [Wenzhouxiangella marina]MBB6085580.1 small subunit ribosomal protein S8 [Wenzhouxiangella marina]